MSQSALTPTANNSLQDWIDWLLGLHATEIELGLDRVKVVAERLNLLSPTSYVITVAGTNGKGSSVAMLSSIYQAAGYKVGSYTSPHILSFNERYQINQQLVTDQTIVDAFVAIETARQTTKLTYFEFSTLAALYIFSQSSLDITILEVGLGGRLDAVNIVDADATLITAIDLDHSEWLGTDREVIGFEKSGIMRANQVCVCSDFNPPKSVAKQAKKLATNYLQAGKDYQLSVLDNNQWQLDSLSDQLTSIANLPKPYLKGSFQCQNSAGVVALIQLIESTSPLKVSFDSLVKGLVSVRHPGRLQELKLASTKQDWLIDVAHNAQSSSALASYLKSVNFKADSVFSVLADKDYQQMVKEITPFINNWYIADLGIARASSLSHLKQILLEAGVDEKRIHCCESIDEASKKAQQSVAKQVLVWGSFFTVSQIFAELVEQGIYIEGISQ
ncbi:MAG TPA: bifunctional folylpolyglutamate synthase/ dihydrofolate synthase [Thiomicrospira sp.]|nr:bifunctional folylpolyglutamate synthase/ dihydrofolate synthase [Thiomicrospira sp.]